MDRGPRGIESSYSTADVLRAASVVAVAKLTLVHVGVLALSAYPSSSLVLFATAVVVAWVGAVGAISRRFYPGIGEGVGVFLLGVSGGTIGLVVVPVAAILLATAFVVGTGSSERRGRLLGR